MKKKTIPELIDTLGVNYDGRPLASNEVLVLSHQDELFISTNVTNADNIVNVPVPNTCKTVKAVLMAVDRQFEDIAKAQFNSWVNDYLGHFVSKMTAEPIEDGQERELPERGQCCSAEDTVIGRQNFEESIRILIQDDPQSAYAALLKAIGYKGTEFDEAMQLKHNTTKRTEIYRKKAEEILEELIKFF